MLITEAKEQLLSRFQSGIWQVIIPTSEKSLGTAPSDASKFYTVEEMDDKFSFVLQALQQGVQKLFQGRAHNVTYWTEQMSRVVFKLSGALVDTCRVEVSSHPREAEVREALLSPFLSAIAHSASMIPESGKTVEFTTRFFVEQPVETSGGIPGRKPEIDYIIRGEDMQGRILYAIPTEAKAQASLDDCKQLASYMCKLMTAKDIARNVLVGLLIDHQDIRLAFSVFAVDDMPLPLTIVGPAMKWRDGVMLVQPTCCALALMYLFSMERVVVTLDQLKELIHNTGIIMKVTEKLVSNPFSLQSARACPTVDLTEMLVKYEEQRQEIQALKVELLEVQSQMAVMQENTQSEQEASKKRKTDY